MKVAAQKKPLKNFAVHNGVLWTIIAKKQRNVSSQHYVFIAWLSPAIYLAQVRDTWRNDSAVYAEA